MFGVVGYMRQIKKDGEFVTQMYTRKTGKFYAKDRYKGIGGDKGVMINPTIPQISAKVDELLSPQPVRKPTTRRKR
jgi:hypothetical protein